MAGGLLRIWGPEARARRDDGQQQGSLPVSDIFREIQEDVRREQIKKLWQAYGSYVIALVVLIFIGSKIFLADLLGVDKLPATLSLGVTFGILAAGVLVSLFKTRMPQPADDPRQGALRP